MKLTNLAWWRSKVNKRIRLKSMNNKNSQVKKKNKNKINHSKITKNKDRN